MYEWYYQRHKIFIDAWSGGFHGGGHRVHGACITDRRPMASNSGSYHGVHYDDVKLGGFANYCGHPCGRNEPEDEPFINVVGRVARIGSHTVVLEYLDGTRHEFDHRSKNVNYYPGVEAVVSKHAPGVYYPASYEAKLDEEKELRESDDSGLVQDTLTESQLLQLLSINPTSGAYTIYGYSGKEEHPSWKEFIGASSIAPWRVCSNLHNTHVEIDRRSWQAEYNTSSKREAAKCAALASYVLLVHGCRFGTRLTMPVLNEVLKLNDSAEFERPYKPTLSETLAYSRALHKAMGL